MQIAAAYLRVSTEDQAEYSPDAQLRALRDWAASNGYQIPDSLVFADEGISGRRADKRPAFQRMVAAARSPDRPFSAILVHKFDRFARSREDSIVYKSLLQREGVKVISITESIDDGGSGMAMLLESISEAYAEFYSVNLGREVKKGMTEKARRGGLQSTPPFGYTAQGGKLVPVPEEAELVRQLFRRYLDGAALMQLAKWVNAQGVRTHRGTPFENRTVEYILRNPAYIGKLRWNPAGRTRRNFDDPNIILADADHEPLVDQELWDAVQARIRQQKALMPYKARPSYALKDWMGGIVRCAHCGGTLIFQRPCYLICNNYVRGRCAHRSMIRTDDLHEAFLSRLRQDVRAADPLEASVVRAFSGDAALAQSLERQISQEERRIQRAREAYLAGADSLDDYKMIRASIEEGLSSLRAQLEAVQAPAEDTQAALRENLQSALETLERDGATTEERHDAALRIIDRCTWDREQQLLSITYRLVL